MKVFGLWWLRRLLVRRLAAVLLAAVVVVGGFAVEARAAVFHGFWIGGKIEEAFHRLGGVKHFGVATTPESKAQFDGRFQHFRRNASIYWHPNMNDKRAHAVQGRIRDKWSSLGWERSVLGYPQTDELTTPDRSGKFNHFRHGSIYWSPATDAHYVRGAIRERWAKSGWERGKLGFPATDELTTPDKKGRFSRFEGGHIYWSPVSGARIVEPDVFEVWARQGWEAGKLGYPTSDRYVVEDGVRQNFEGGVIHLYRPVEKVLPRFDGKGYSSYRHVYPLFALEEGDHRHPEGAARELVAEMANYVPLRGCPQRVEVGSVCELPTANGGIGRVVVSRIADDGVNFVTDAGHPEGEGRMLNVRFDEVKAPAEAGPEVVFDSGLRESAYFGSNKRWLRVIVEAFGDTSSTQLTGPFVSEHVGRQVWPKLAQSLRRGLVESTTVYAPLGN